MLPQKELKELKRLLDESKNPLFIFDGDSDGVCSFLLMHKYKKEGNYMPMRTSSINGAIVHAAKRFDPDIIFTLDAPNIEQEFVDEMKVPIVQVDHHLGGNVGKGVRIFNPRLHDKEDSSPTTSICYNALHENLWLAAIGVVSDWHITKETKEFAKKNPTLLNAKITNPPEAIFTSKIGLLSRLFNFVQKGKVSDGDKAIEMLMKINAPEDILEQKTPAGEWLWKRFQSLFVKYEEMLAQAEKSVTRSKLVVFSYDHEEASVTKELSNEMIYRHSKKIIIIARKKDDEYRCSVRSGSIEIRSKLLKAFEGLEAKGGGHDRACGANVKVKDWDIFLEQFKKQIKAK